VTGSHRIDDFVELVDADIRTSRGDEGAALGKSGPPAR